MIHFVDRAADGELMAELRDTGVLAPDAIDRIFSSMGRPEKCSLSEFLLAGSDVVPEKAWLEWLIRRHGCHRFGRVGWHPEAAAWAWSGPPPEGNYPYRECADKRLLVAVLRPDLLEATVQRWHAPLHRAAATLAELRALNAAWLAAAERCRE